MFKEIDPLKIKHCLRRGYLLVDDLGLSDR